jgi:uncharacterized protein (DUF362 family)/Pyruvate/2-oxoacid:ferredoxin oxidoreductase delta subunit
MLERAFRGQVPPAGCCEGLEVCRRMKSQNVQETPIVSVARCETYDLDAARQAVSAVLAPLGGMARFVRPGMQVLLKPNLLSDAGLERAVTTHPAVVQAVAEQVRAAGGTVLAGDSPSGPVEGSPRVWRESGLARLAEQEEIRLVPFDTAAWKRLNGRDYFVAPAALEADLVINLPKLKTHTFALYTGAVKNLFGVIPGMRKRELHYRAPGIEDFSRVLVDVLELVQPGLTIMDGILGQEGSGPGAGGTPHRYACLAASTDPVALDAVITQAMGYRPGEVRHLVQASARRMGVSDLRAIRVQGERQVLDFGALRLPRAHWYFRMPSWISAPLHETARVRPVVMDSLCIGCGRCVEVCPREAITAGRPPTLDMEECIGCLCCAEVCPQGAIQAQRNLIARLFGMGR